MKEIVSVATAFLKVPAEETVMVLEAQSFLVNVTELELSLIALFVLDGVMAIVTSSEGWLLRLIVKVAEVVGLMVREAGAAAMEAPSLSIIV